MLTKPLMAIDRFYLILAGVLFILFLLVFFTFKEGFSAVKTAAEINEEIIGAEVGINTENLNKAYEAAFNKKNVSLDLTK